MGSSPARSRLRFRRSTSCSWIRPESASMYCMRSAVGWVHQIDPLKPCFTSLGSKPAMVDVGVGQDDRIDVFRLEGERFGIEFFQCAGTLKHPAIHQDRTSVMGELHARSGHGVRRPVEGQRQLFVCHGFLSSVRPVALADFVREQLDQGDCGRRSGDAVGRTDSIDSGLLQQVDFRGARQTMRGECFDTRGSCLAQ